MLQQRPGVFESPACSLFCVWWNYHCSSTSIEQSDQTSPDLWVRGEAAVLDSNTCILSWPLAAPEPVLAPGRAGFCLWQQSSPGSVTYARDVVNWQLLRARQGIWGGCCFCERMEQLLAETPLPTLSFACPSSSGIFCARRQVPEVILMQGKSSPFALLKSLSVGTLLPNSLLTNRNWWPKSPSSSLLHSVEDLLVSREPCSQGHHWHFCSGLCVCPRHCC